MTCSHLIDSYTNSKFIYGGVSRFRQSFSCGRCSSCIRKQRTDWRVRSYYESASTLKKRGSFVLFDTLTYCDDFIKTYSDIFPEMSIPYMLNKSCFSRADVQKFFKRLRINLKRAGYRYDSNQLRYILTSEYGSDEKVNGFQRTHRPHYHILFFVSFPISPVVFSRFISQSWHLGKTDGVKPYDDCSLCPIRNYCRGVCLYQSPDYVMNERLVNKDSSANCMKCVNYVTKYISKDMYVSDKLQFQIDLLWSYLYPDYKSDLLLYRSYRRFCSQVLPFHLQSQGFGLDLLNDDEERDYIIRTNKVHLPSSKRDVITSVALPRYYQRKLYYDFKKVDGHVKWFLNSFGVNTKVKQLDDRISSFMRDYRSFDSSIPEDDLYQLSLYRNVYRGTLTDYRSLYLPYKDYYRNMISPHDDNEEPLYYNFNTKRDKLSVGSFLSPSYKVTSDGEIIYKGKQLHCEFIPFEGYLVVNDSICPYWHGFDRKLVAFERWRNEVSLARDVIQYSDDANVDYYKCLGLLS